MTAILRTLLTGIVTLAAAPLCAANLNFCWVGAAGYTMTGTMQFPDALLYKAVVTDRDVTRFKISGYRDGTYLGGWDMADRGDETTFHLRFDPIGMVFLMGGSFPTTHSQGWNADGRVENCGTPGFGFNSGNFGQDVCVNGRYILESSIAPDTPLFATTAAVTPDCGGAPLTGKARKTNRKLD